MGGDEIGENSIRAAIAAQKNNNQNKRKGKFMNAKIR